MSRGCISKIAHKRFKTSTDIFVLPFLNFFIVSCPNMPVSFATVVFGAVATMRGGRRSAAGQNITAQALGFRRYIQYLSTHQLTMQLRDNGLYFYDLCSLAVQKHFSGKNRTQSALNVVPLGLQNLLIALIGATDALMLGRFRIFDCGGIENIYGSKISHGIKLIYFND